MYSPDRLRLLYVDDEEPNQTIISRLLAPHFEVVTANSGAQGLEILGGQGMFAVILSDLRMPNMDGVTFLAEVRKRHPEPVRVLLTGAPDLQAAIDAINEGSIFRFLTRPCTGEVLLRAVQDAAEQFRLKTAELVLLEQTLSGAVRALVDVLSASNPVAYGRAVRARTLMSGFLSHVLNPGEVAPGPDGRVAPMAVPAFKRWEVEIGTMLSQLGSVGLPDQIAQKVYYGKPLDKTERAMTERVPLTSAELIAHIPRLEGVRSMLLFQNKHFDGAGLPEGPISGELIPWGARVLKIVLDFVGLGVVSRDELEAMSVMRNRAGWYDPQLLEAFGRFMDVWTRSHEAREIPVTAVRTGMLFAEDIVAKDGALIAAQGIEVTEGHLERIRNLWNTFELRKPVRVLVDRDGPENR